MKMPFPQQIKNLFRPNSNKPMDLEEVFELVYGRKPSRNEIVLLRGLTRDVPKSDQMNIFRAVINGFDHQSLNTPFTVRFSSRDVEYVPVEHFELAIDKQDISVSAPLKQGEYELHLLEFFRERLKPGMTFIDIGANVGLYSMFAARIVGGNGKVFSFEPNSENCRLIMLSKYRNEFENVTVYPMALGNKTGHAFFSTHIGSNGGLIANTQETLWNPSCVVVPVVRLQDIVTERVDAIKMDVEGAEGLVIEGARELIEKYRPIVTSEFSLEMLPRVSKMSGEDYLGYFKVCQYDIYLCDKRTKKLNTISNIDAFIGDYGEITRIEDLVFIPK